jgi:divalent metal cation (Fe/Co/Zn/Cd) transporter
MISDRRTVLRSLEILVSASGILGIVSGALIVTRIFDAQIFEPFVFCLFAAMFLVFAAAIWVAAEFTQARRLNSQATSHTDGLSLSELRTLIHWCPSWIAIFSVGGILVGLGTAFYTGDVNWSTGKPLSEREALSLMVGTPVHGIH